MEWDLKGVLLSLVLEYFYFLMNVSGVLILSNRDSMHFLEPSDTVPRIFFACGVIIFYILIF